MVDHAPFLATRMAGDIFGHGRTRILGHGQACLRQDLFRHAEVIGHEDMERHIEALLGGPDRAVVHAGTQQMFYAVRPIGD